MSDSPAVQIKKAFGDPLIADGFQRKGSTWRRLEDRLIQAVELQKSDLAESWYINIGFFIRSGDPSNTLPPVHHCHFYYRLDSIFLDHRIRIHKLLNLDIPMDLDERLEELSALSKDTIIPFLKGLRNEEALKGAFTKPWFENGLVTLKGRNLLGLPPPD